MRHSKSSKKEKSPQDSFTANFIKQKQLNISSNENQPRDIKVLKDEETPTCASMCYDILKHKIIAACDVMVIRFPAQVSHKLFLTLYFTHRYFDAALTSFPCIFLRVIVGKSASLKNKPTRLPTF